ncbi:MAG TPA: hypothetical protein EYO31_00570 [Phycisphaerales bacterium]|nr:hypothetical protein [Phycisphaerales bacterium]
MHQAYAPSTQSLNLLDVIDWDEDARREALQGSPIKRASLSMMRRNAIIVLGNTLTHSPDSSALAKLQTIATKESDVLVQKTAEVVVEMLAS